MANIYKLKTEIIKLKDSIGDDRYLSEFEKGCNEGKNEAYDDVLRLIETIEKDSTPKHSHIESIYHSGKEPTWKVGDILAEYEFYSDREGEIVHGEVTKVGYDKKFEDWFYEFDKGAVIFEEELITNEAYKKN